MRNAKSGLHGGVRRTALPLQDERADADSTGPAENSAQAGQQTDSWSRSACEQGRHRRIAASCRPTRYYGGAIHGDYPPTNGASCTGNRKVAVVISPQVHRSRAACPADRVPHLSPRPKQLRKAADSDRANGFSWSCCLRRSVRCFCGSPFIRSCWLRRGCVDCTGRRAGSPGFEN